nr:unnamed protein product [Digitaria exilis]
MLHDAALATATSLPVVVACLLLLVVLHPIAAQQQLQMLSFSKEDTAWRPSDGHRILVSSNRNFAAGFRPDSPGKYRFAVWVVASNDGSSNPDDAVIWYAAHRSNYSAVKGDRTSALAIDAAGRLSWTAAGGIVIWSPPVPRPAAVELWLNDKGSLVYGDGSWSSFEEPTDTVMAGQAIPSEAGEITTLQSASGRYRLTRDGKLHLGDQEYSRLFPPLLNLTDDGTLVQEGFPNSRLVATDLGNTTLLRRLTLDDDGNLRLYSMVPKSPPWRVVWHLLQDICFIPGTCAAGSICVPVGTDSIDCVCPPGYQNFTTQDREDGRSPWACLLKVNYSGRGDDDKFVPLDFVTFSGNGSIREADHGPLTTKLQQPKNLDECQKTCRLNPRCVAFGYKLDGFRTCLLYWGLVDGYWDPVAETTTYLRVAKSNNDTNPFDARLTEEVVTACSEHAALPKLKRALTMSMPEQIALITILFVVELLVGALSVWQFLRKYSRYREAARVQVLQEWLPADAARRFSYAELKAATRDFSDVVGRGAFGTVYRGDLPDGRALAVKLLRGVDGGGGEAEFWAELTIVARMHHLNLVRMWGFCADQDKRMLVYEYVPNGSLDRHLFGNAGEEAAAANSPPPLDLHTRYRIAQGVARAIAYLHEECLEWVLHCDIKPENILLDHDFCPKVSDFGVSKLVTKQDRVTMSRIRGTRGYMAPEWVMHGHPITSKADVYSFGMVLLEIVSGRRACGFQLVHYDSEEWYFPKWAYEKAYEELQVREIVDPRLLPTASSSYYDDATVDRMLKTAMWCLQDRAEMRPSMGKVAKMLEGSVDIIGKPLKPTIFCLQEYHDVTTTGTLDTGTVADPGSA